MSFDSAYAAVFFVAGGVGGVGVCEYDPDELWWEMGRVHRRVLVFVGDELGHGGYLLRKFDHGVYGRDGLEARHGF